MQEEILRNTPNLDLYTILIIVSLVLQVIAKYSFRFEYQKFLNRESSESFNTILIYLISALSYLMLLALLLTPVLKQDYLFYFNTPLKQYGFCLSVLIILTLVKLIIKSIWYSSFESFNSFIKNINDKAYISFWKYLVTLLFIIVFIYSPLRIYYHDSYAILLFLGLYIFDVGFEYSYIQKMHLGIVLYKFLYLCTLEILPVLVFLKLLFILN